MTREEFIAELTKKLDRLPKDELDSAIEYYNEVFYEAGSYREAETAEQLGNIDEIARQIYTENGIDPDGRPSFLMEEYVEPSTNSGYAAEGAVPYNAPYRAAPSGSISGTGLILLIVLFPFWFPLAMAALALTLVFAVLLLVLEILLISVGVASAGSGLALLFSVPPVGFTYFGAGLFLIGLAGLTVGSALKGVKNILVGAVNAVVGTCRRLIFGGAA